MKIFWKNLWKAKNREGKIIEVIFHGIESSDGPDFKSAEIIFDGVRMEGDVECHIFSSDWWRHKHHKDPKYKNVILEIIWEKDEDFNEYEGFKPLLTIPISELEVLEKKKFLCSKFDRKVALEELKKLGLERIKLKSERIRRRIEEIGKEEAFFEFLSIALGYEKYKIDMLIFKRKVKIQNIRLMSEEEFKSLVDNFLKTIPRKRVRPQNQIEKRLWQLFYLSKFPLDFFEKKENWEKIKVKGLGKDRLRTIIINVFVPFLIATGNKIEEILDFIDKIPMEEKNRYIREGLKILPLKLNLIQGQGMIELFLRRCSKYMCSICPIPINTKK